MTLNEAHELNLIILIKKSDEWARMQIQKYLI